MLRTTFAILGVVGTATAVSQLKECNLCDAGEELESTKKHGVCTADSRYAEDECFSCMESGKPGRSANALTATCLACDFSAGNAFCSKLMDVASCNTNGASFVCDVGTPAKVTDSAGCRTTFYDESDAVPHAYCSKLMGEPYCQANPTASFICDDGTAAKPGTVTGDDWTKCPRKKGTINEKDPSCTGCIEKNVAEAKPWYVQSCYDCFNDKDASGNKPTNKAWCAKSMGEPTCNTNGASFVCDVGTPAKVTNTTSCPLHPTTPSIPPQTYKWCASIMGEPTCSGANPTSSFQCDPTAAGGVVNPITTMTSCPTIAHTDVTLWSTDKAACDKGASKMNDMTCSNIQSGIGNITVAECNKMKKIYSGCCRKSKASGSTATVLSALAGAAATLAGLVMA